jgi:hypothetical protein
MASELEWTDSEGTETLTNGYPAPGDRFAAWHAKSPIVGPAESALAGTLHVYEFRADYTASFELRGIPQSQVAAALRLIRHLNRGGEVTVYTGDAEDNVYTCQKVADSDPDLGPPDPKDLRRTLKLTLRNTEQADLLCLWP